MAMHSATFTVLHQHEGIMSDWHHKLKLKQLLYNNNHKD